MRRIRPPVATVGKLTPAAKKWFIGLGVTFVVVIVVAVFGSSNNVSTGGNPAPENTPAPTSDISAPADDGQLRAIQLALCPTSSLNKISSLAEQAASSTSNLSPYDVAHLVLMEDYKGQSCVQAFALAVALAP